MEKKEDDASNWIQQYKENYKQFSDWEKLVLQEFARIDSQHGSNKTSNTDLKLIAWSKVTGATVVTLEKRARGAHKIPNICEKEQISCINMLGMIKAEGWTF